MQQQFSPYIVFNIRKSSLIFSDFSGSLFSDFSSSQWDYSLRKALFKWWFISGTGNQLLNTFSLQSLCPKAVKYLRQELLKIVTALVFAFLSKRNVQSIHYLTQAVIPHYYCPNFWGFFFVFEGLSQETGELTGMAKCSRCCHTWLSLLKKKNLMSISQYLIALHLSDSKLLNLL